MLKSLLVEFKRVGDKAVIVSNFTSHLDKIDTLATSMDWRVLRIDGQVASAVRQSLVDRFNSTNDNSTFLFLLSSKAGGVGLNLIGKMFYLL